MPDEQHDDLPDGVTLVSDGYHVKLKFPDKGGDESVTVRPMRMRDFRKLMELEDAESDGSGNALATVSGIFQQLTRLSGEQVEGLAMEDVGSIREVIYYQAKKLTAG